MFKADRVAITFAALSLLRDLLIYTTFFFFLFTIAIVLLTVLQSANNYAYDTVLYK